MPRPSRRNDIIDATLRILAARGFKGLTARDIGQQAGLSGASIYNHFESLEHLITAALEVATSDLSEEYGFIFEQRISDQEKLKSYTALSVARHVHDPTMVHVLHHALAEENVAAIAVFNDNYRHKIYPKFRRISSKVARNVDPEKAHFIISSLATGLALHKQSRGLARPRFSEASDLLTFTDMILCIAYASVDWHGVKAIPVHNGRLLRNASG